MAIEIVNSLHAMAFVSTQPPGSFIGQGNVGFAAFGVGDPNSSEHLITGTVRLHLLEPLALSKGEGIVFATVVNHDDAVANPVLPDRGSADVVIQTSAGGSLLDLNFTIVILRLPQQSTTPGT